MKDPIVKMILTKDEALIEVENCAPLFIPNMPIVSISISMVINIKYCFNSFYSN